MIPKEAIEAARNALLAEAAKAHEGWHERNDALVTAALEAAAPWLRAQALEELIAECEQSERHLAPFQEYPNTYGAYQLRDAQGALRILRARAATERGQE